MSRMQEFSMVDTQTGGRESFRFGYNAQGGSEFEPIAPLINEEEDDDNFEDNSQGSYSQVNDMSGGGKRDRIEREALEELLGHSVVDFKQSGGMSYFAKNIDDSSLQQDVGHSDNELKLMTDPGIMGDDQDPHSANVIDLAHNSNLRSRANILGGSRAVSDTKQAWWKQTGGCGESNSQCGTSSIENIVSGFVNDALQGGKRAAKKNMRRSVSSASSDAESQSDSDDATSSEEEAPPKKGKKAKADKKDKPARAPTDWMIYLGKVRETVGNAENANKVALLTAFASSYKKAAEAQGKTGKELYKVAFDSFLAEWKSGVGKKKLSAAKPKEK